MLWAMMSKARSRILRGRSIRSMMRTSELAMMKYMSSSRKSGSMLMYFQ